MLYTQCKMVSNKLYNYMIYLQYHKYLFCFIKSQKCMNFIKIINVPVTSWWQKENFLRECCGDHFKEMANLIKSLSINLKVFFTFFLCYAKITFFIPLHRLSIWNNFFYINYYVMNCSRKSWIYKYMHV